MRKYIFIPFILLICFSYSGYCQTGKLTELEFIDSLKEIWQNNPNKTARKKAIQLCLSNPNNSSSLLNLFMLRKHIPKVKLKEALNTVSPDLNSNEYFKCLSYYIENEQLKIGDQYADFKAQLQTGQQFRLSELINQKDVLIIFDGLNCMGKEAVQSWVELYSQLDKQKVEIVSFLYTVDKEQFAKALAKSPVPWTVISDFKGDHSYTKIKYNAQGTPTFVYINSNGKILELKEGPSRKSVKLLKRYLSKS